MSLPILFFIAGQLFTALVFGIIGLVGIGYRHRALKQEVARVAAGSEVIDAYQRFVAVRTRSILLTRRITTALLTAAVLGFACILAFSIINALEPIGTFNIYAHISILKLFPFVGPLIFSLFIGFFIGTNGPALINPVVVDAEALQIFQVGTLQRSAIVRLKLRSALLKFLPETLYLEVLGCILLLIDNYYLAMSLVLLGIAILIVYQAVFAVQRYGLEMQIKPIEQSEWAALTPRILAWAQLAEVSFAAVYIQQDLVGTVNVRVPGLLRPTLIISETFLRFSEWRQQDALIGLAISMARKQTVRKNLLRNLLRLAITTVIVMLLPLSLYLTRLGYILGPLLLVALIALRYGRIALRFSSRPGYLDADRMTAFLTGDPVAIMVMFTVANALNGIPSNYQTAARPVVQARMQKLDALIRQPWPRAPYAAVPVPAMMPVKFGPYILTTPLSETTNPAPVPPTPYVKLDIN